VTGPLAVVKIGGGLLGSPRLDPLLAAIAAARPARAVVVPGGGPFADAVRETQAAMGFGDALAHRLALDAMGHVAAILSDRHPALAVAAGAEEFAARFQAGRVPVWHPRDIRSGRPDIPETWDVTSDSLAAWLGAEIGADRLVLVKSVDAPPGASPRDLAEAGLVDAAFPTFAARFGGTVAAIGPSSDHRLAALLAAGLVRSDAA
jgi:5-(aminomethyl)-3-furanmethanol phosphate kinase